MTQEQADELIKDLCSEANDCNINCRICPYWKQLLKCDFPEDDDEI